MNGVLHVQQCLAILVLSILGLGLAGCGTTNKALDATSLYTRGQNQSALEVLSEAKSNPKKQQWATLQEVTVALDASQFDRAASVVAWVESRGEVLDERAVISVTEVEEDLGSALIDERLPEWVLFGEIDSIESRSGRRTQYDYAVNLRLLSVRDGASVWEDQIVFTKQFEKGLFGG